MERAAGYVAGVVTLAAVVGPLWWAAVQLRKRLLPGWNGARAALADTVAVVSGLLVASQALGSVGMFRRLPLVATSVVVGIGAGLVARRSPRPAAVPAPTPPVEEGMLARAVAVGAAGGVASLWLYRTAATFGGGITEWDSLWYHLPFAARWVQLGSLTQLHDVGNPAGTFLPVNMEVFHALGMVAFGHDVLSPLLNLLWLALLLLAAWCAGQTAGRPYTTLTLGALVMGVRVMQESQPGTANIDVAAVTLVLAAVALALHPERRTYAYALAGAAIGLAAGTKLTLLPVAVALALLVGVAAGRGARRRVLPAAAGAAVLTGGFWYARNLVRVGNPLPWVDLRIGSFGFRGLELVPVDCGVDTVLDYAAVPAVWHEWFAPGLRWAFGPLWWLLLAVGLAAAGLAVVRGRSPTVRALGATGLVAWVAYVVTPASAGGTNGMPHCFSYNLRFFVPALALVLLVVCIVLPIRYARFLPLALGAVLVVTSLGSNTAGQASVVVGLGLAGTVLWYGRRRGDPPGAGRRWRAAVAVVVVMILLGGVPATDWYLTRRYADVEFQQALGSAAAWARGVHGARIAVVGLAMHYPLYGLHGVDNRVEHVSLPTPAAQSRFQRPDDCDAWRGALHAGGFTHVVTGSYDTDDPLSRQTLWTISDPRAREILRDGSTLVFSLSAAPGPTPCD